MLFKGVRKWRRRKPKVAPATRNKYKNVLWVEEFRGAKRTSRGSRRGETAMVEKALGSMALSPRTRTTTTRRALWWERVDGARGVRASPDHEKGRHAALQNTLRRTLP